ncbi:conserved hypothetical protein [Magnetospirillum sp. UT-4]|nr:conserved hypothetical protein [Magnetospirillum sp. UT-4]
MQAPAVVRDAFKRLRESDIKAEAAKRETRVANGNCAWDCPLDDADEATWMMALGAQIRAVETWMNISVAHALGEPASADAWYCAATDHYAVPRRRPFRPKDHHPYERRGLLYHRIIPAEVSGYQVRITLDNARDPSRDGITRMGAALLQDFRFTHTRHGDGFLIDSVEATDMAATIGAQVERACGAACYCVVWPELALSPAARDHIATLLRHHDGRNRPAVVVAGSWHQRDGSVARNVGTVLDGYGRSVLTFAKALPFTHDSLGPEAIQGSHAIEVLVTRDSVIAFAICRDYCDNQVLSPFPDLDVDLILVPSLGNAATMDGHRVTAKRAALNHGTRTFVVQQDLPAGTDPRLGLVLPPQAGADQKALAQSDVWKVYEVTSLGPYYVGGRTETL